MDEIVRRLMSRSKNSIVESLQNSHLHEEDENNEEDFEMPEDSPEEDFEVPETDDSETDISDDDISNRPVQSDDTPPEDDEYIDPEGDVDSPGEYGSDTKTYVNPLDNNYAVNYTIGDEVLLAYSNGTATKLKGEVEGYDKEGFYRIRWANGLTTNGITDLALSDLVSSKKESTCVCGSTNFVTEGDQVICDECGRPVGKTAPIQRKDVDESTLPSAKSKKDKIRSEVHPMSTSLPEGGQKKSIKDSIRSAFKRVQESYDQSIFGELESIKGDFWTRREELVDDIRELGYIVEEDNAEYVVVSSPADDETVLLIPIGGTARTMYLDLDKAREM